MEELEKKPKANPDYTKSAVDLSAPPATLAAYEVWRLANDEARLIQLDIETLIPVDKAKARDEAVKKANEAYKVLAETIESAGGFQRVEHGEYALKQKRESIKYRPDLAKINLPEKFLPAVIIESVDAKVLEQLVKGGSITEEQARASGEVKETYAIVIK